MLPRAGVTLKENYDSVKKLFIIALCEDIKESRENVRIIWDHLNVNQAKFIFVGDLKVPISC